jgi:hypothetical protein
MDFKSEAGQLSATADKIFKSYFNKNDAVISFNHSRIFEDGSRAELWANGIAMEHTYLESGLTIRTHAPKLYESNEKFTFLLDKIQSFHDKAKENYRRHLSEVDEFFGYGNVLLVKGSDPLCHEVFCFYGAKNDALFRSYVVNNIEKLDGFIEDFKSKNEKLIKIAEENRIVKPWINQRMTLKIKLTEKEKLIAKFYSRGLSAKNIAFEMGIKEKTVLNYLELIKDKYLLAENRGKEELIRNIRLDYTLFHE